MNVGLIGCGLIGGSMVMALREKGWLTSCIGVDASKQHADSARAYGFIDAIGTLDEVLEKCDVILLAVPVQHILEMLPSILDQINSSQVVIDFGSTKAAMCERVRDHRARSQYVAAHPIAGTENTGPSAAHLGLFRDKVNIICDREATGIHAIDIAASLFRALEMKTIFMESTEHDRHIAYVSHLSHISSFMLGHTVLDIEKDEKSIFNMAGSGFQSTVRLAMSSPEMWAPIFTQNAPFILTALDEYISHLSSFRDKLRQGDEPGMQETMLRANQIRRVLKKEN